MYNDAYEEADDVADQVVQGMADGVLRPRDVAIFCRMNALTRTLEHAFRARGVAYQIVNGLEFYQRKEIKDLLGYLHLINNPSNDVALLRVINTPARGIGLKTIKALTAHANLHRIPILEAAREANAIEGLAARSAKKVLEFVRIFDHMQIKATAPLADLITYILEESGYQEHLEKTVDESLDNDRLANVDELITSAVEFDQQFPEDGSLDLFLEQVALVSDTDAFEGDDDKVTLMTLHAAKGLEFPRVFIIGVENGLLPHSRSADHPAQLEEERRLLFVGITRAEKNLQLSYTKRRVIRGTPSPAAPSHFLVELPRASLDMRQTPDPADYFYGSGNLSEADAEEDYPESWDDIAPVDDQEEFNQLPEDERRESESDEQVRETQVPGGLTTAAQLLANHASSPRPPKLRSGMRVEHPDYGEGVVQRTSGAGPKQTVRIDFESGESHSFRVSFAKLRVIAE